MRSCLIKMVLIFITIWVNLVIWDQIIENHDYSIHQWSELLSCKEWNVNPNWKFSESKCRNIYTRPTFHTVNYVDKSELTTTIDIILRNDTDENELLFKYASDYWKTELCEWRITAISKMHFEIEIKRSSETNEELTIIAISNNKVKTFEPKSLSSWSNDPLHLDINQTNYMLVKGYALNQHSSYEISIKFTKEKDESIVFCKSVIVVVIIFFLLFLLVILTLVIDKNWRGVGLRDRHQFVQKNQM